MGRQDGAGHGQRQKQAPAGWRAQAGEDGKSYCRGRAGLQLGQPGCERCAPSSVRASSPCRPHEPAAALRAARRTVRGFAAFGVRFLESGERARVAACSATPPRAVAESIQADGPVGRYGLCEQNAPRTRSELPGTGMLEPEHGQGYGLGPEHVQRELPGRPELVLELELELALALVYRWSERYP